MALAVALGLPVFTWYGWYRWAGYSEATLLAVQLFGLAAAVALVAGFGLGWRRLGLGLRHAGQAVAVGAVAYVVVALIATVLNLAANAGLGVLRPSYDWWPFVNNWFLTAGGEELLFAAVLFTLVRSRLPATRGWLAVIIVALLFGLAHLPGYLAIGYDAGGVAGRLSLNVASWLIFGTIYLLSGNLWLVIVAHASTDYGLTPLITQEPLLGLVFMATLVAGSWWLGRQCRLRSPRQDFTGPRKESGHRAP